MAKREKKKADNRLKLIESAAAAFASQGVKGANINLISVGAGLGKGTVYNYFGSKDSLFSAVLTWSGEMLAKVLEAADGGPREAETRLRSHSRALFSFYQERPALAKLLIRTLSDDRVDFQQALVAAFNPLVNRVQTSLRDGIAEKHFRSNIDPFISAMTLWGMINHQAAFHWLVSNRPLDPDGLTELVMAYFLSGVKR